MIFLFLFCGCRCGAENQEDTLYSHVPEIKIEPNKMSVVRYLTRDLVPGTLCHEQPIRYPLTLTSISYFNIQKFSLTLINPFWLRLCDSGHLS